MSKRTNDVTLFSNGIGHFRRIYKVPAGKREAVSIPFKRDNIGDVAASLQVFGPVKLNTPPSFTPMNANATALRIDPSNALRSLYRSLSGANVKVKFTDSASAPYTLLGIESYFRNVNQKGEKVETDCIVLMHGGSVCRKLFSDVQDVHFEDESVRMEIDKALKNNFQLIKPDSTLMDLSLTAIGEIDAEAIVQYTIPVAAWKMRYAIREEKGKFSLEGAAIIDNNTDEDWDNFRVSVVTGNPISFNTDIANVVVPVRKFVRLVDGNTLGNVTVEDAHAEAQQQAITERGLRGVAYAGRMSKSSLSNVASFGLASSPGGGMELESLSPSQQPLELAESVGVESKEVGDFCVFTSKEPITILARKSAVVPMFSVPLTRAGIVLFYNEKNHARRPYRTVKFKNETEYSLGKGKTVIYNEGIFSGECVLEATKPGENRMLPHCLENGVKFVRETNGVQHRRSSLRFSDGVVVCEDVSVVVTTYRIENKKDESFKLAVEHQYLIPGLMNDVTLKFDGVEISEKEKLQTNDGYRLYFELAANQVVNLKVTETSVIHNSVVLGNHFNWVKQNLIDTKNPLVQHEQVRAAIALQGEIDSVANEIGEATKKKQDLAEQAVRTRQNLGAVKESANNVTVTLWVQDLHTTENEIRSIDKEVLPDLNKKLKALKDKMTTVLRAISVSWKE